MAVKDLFVILTILHWTVQTTKVSIKYFSSKCDQIRRKLRIWSRLLKKFLMENFIFCVVFNHTPQLFHNPLIKLWLLALKPTI